MFALLKSLPVTTAMIACALLAHLLPSGNAWLELDFAAVGEGQWWRLWTGHLTHFGGEHLFWDLLMFGILGAACENQQPRRFLLAMPLLIAGISATIWLTCPDILTYRGLSGIDTGLFVWFVSDRGLAAWQTRDRGATLCWLGLGGSLIGKLVFEALTGNTLFVDSTAFRPLVEAHLGGAVLGLLCGLSGIASWFGRLAFTSSPELVWRQRTLSAVGHSGRQTSPNSPRIDGSAASH